MLTLEEFESAVRIAAVVLGGFWAYFKFFKGRVIAPRIDPSISADVVRREGRTYLVAKLEVKNVGGAKVNLLQAGAGLIVSGYRKPESVTFAKNVEQEHLATFPVLERHQWIEPARTIREERLIAVPSNQYHALRLECTIVYRNILPILRNVSNTVSTVIIVENVETEEIDVKRKNPQGRSSEVGKRRQIQNPRDRGTKETTKGTGTQRG